MFCKRRCASAAQRVAKHTKRVDADRLRRVQKLLDRHVSEGNIGGASTAIFQEGEELLRYCNGDMREDSIVRCASMTKLVTAICALSLLEDGLLYFDEDLTAKWLPELANMPVISADLKEEKRHEKITMLHLLSHTSGLAYLHSTVAENDPMKDRIKVVTDRYREHGLWDGLCVAAKEGDAQDMLDKLAKCALVCQPGTHYLYSLGYDVAGIVIERITKKSLGEVMTERVFELCGLRDTGFFVPKEKRHRMATIYTVPDDGGPLSVLPEAVAIAPWTHKAGEGKLQSGGSGLCSTLDDLSKLCLAVVRCLRGEPPAAGRRMLAPYTAQLMMNSCVPPGLSRSDLHPGLAQTIGCFSHEEPGLMGEPLPKGSLYIMGFFGCRALLDPENDIVAILCLQRFPGTAGDLRHTWAAAVYQAVS